jgi:hypothetical protein
MSPKDRILARRAQFMAAAIVGIAGCSASTDPTSSEPRVCLSPPYRDTGADTRDTGPTVCLTSSYDATGADTVDTSGDDAADTSVGDSAPMPCLSMPPPDASDS